jgi:hypothetical protein
MAIQMRYTRYHSTFTDKVERNCHFATGTAVA